MVPEFVDVVPEPLAPVSAVVNELPAVAALASVGVTASRDVR